MGKHKFLQDINIHSHCIKQNYHWTDGFFVRNHPLKEAEKLYKFCFRVKVFKGGARGSVGHRENGFYKPS